MFKFISATFVLWISLFSGISKAGERPTVLFDQGHGQKFLIEKTGPLDLSNLSELFRQKELTLKSSKENISDELLSGVSTLVISGPFIPFSTDEIDSIVNFIKRGGRLCIMLHIGPPVVELLHRLEVDVSNGVIREREGVIEGEALNFHVTRLANHDLNKGLKQFNIYGGWALMNTGDNTAIIAETGPTSWVDLDRDKKFSAGDAVQSFGVAVAGKIGDGRFVVFGDDAIFQNRFLDEVNILLGKNLVAWLTED